ncbi:E3 ubiquitin-protein ligase RHA2A-like isoform X3 [Phoenix dactylifera]|uniref:E3 ubiquitin-protein ligase RHA2A-like isoform X3 n=1 Tax=Phoenix dactylifera TaxID=42345 RepID=A0A8B8ZEV7_PHODC|nr:E3 ubiquitin-protein ligase RHA2A-like isoform X3 [Phoenix dactylifera]
MGLPNRLHDASSDSIPILLVVAAAGWVSYLRSLLLCLLHSLGLQRLHPSSAAADDPLFSAAGSGLAGLVVVASSGRPFAYEALPSAATEGEQDEPGCVVCLCELADGDRLRRLDLSNRFMKALHLFKVMQLEKSAKPIGLVDEGCRVVGRGRRDRQKHDNEARCDAEDIREFQEHYPIIFATGLRLGGRILADETGTELVLKERPGF